MDKRDYAVDLIRLIAILAVIVIHATSYFVDRLVPFSFNFYFLYGVNQTMRAAVPLFFCISGYLLASRCSDTTSLATFYKKRVSKLFLPYLLWSLIYFYIVFSHPISLTSLGRLLDDLITGNASYQLYFIPAIIVLYAIFPFIMKYRKMLLSNKFLIVLALLEGAILSYTYFYNVKLPVVAPIRIAVFNILVFMIGMYAALNIKDLRKFIHHKASLFKFLVVASWVVVFAESLLMFAKTGNGDFLRNQWRISVMVYGVSVGALLYNYYKTSWNNKVAYFASFSFGIFFVHAAILHNIMILLDKYNLHNLFWFTIALATTIFLSFLFSIVLSKNKLANKFLGLRS